MSLILCINLVLWQAANGLTVFYTSLSCILPNVAKFRVSLKFPENGGLFHHASVYCFTECHMYTTETLLWRMQFVVQCYFFEFGYLFWLVYKCAQIAGKKGKVDNMGHDFSQRPPSLCAVCNWGVVVHHFFHPMNGVHFADPPPHPHSPGQSTPPKLSAKSKPCIASNVWCVQCLLSHAHM